MFTMSRYTRRLSRGFTAIELMVTMAVLAILAAIAAPSFNPLIERWRIRQASEELQSTFYFARSEAIKRGGGIAIARSGSATDCTALADDDWNCGWIVFADADHDDKQGSDDKEATLQAFSIPAKISVIFTDASNGKPTFIKVDRWGQLSSSDSAVNFTLQLKGSSDAQASTLCVSSSGRISKPAGTSCT